MCMCVVRVHVCVYVRGDVYMCVVRVYVCICAW